MRLHNEENLRFQTALKETSQQGVSPAFTEGVDIYDALRTEQAAVAWGVGALYEAVLSGAELSTVCDAVATVKDACMAHLILAEQMLRESRGGLQEHVAARRTFLSSLTAAQNAVRMGQVEATLDIADLLTAFQAQLDQWLQNPSLPAYSWQQKVLRAGTVN